jgi:O-acetyl-ADP-ribose deacetylase (regulator of RNase III)
MKIDILNGDMFASGADSLVCPVNCIGVMGAGLAKVFAKRYPDASAVYRRECRDGAMDPGDVIPVLSRSAERLPSKPGPLLYFAATKQHWRDPSQLEWVQRCAHSLVNRARANASTQESIVIPALGVGCGGLSWEAVRPILLDAADQIEAVGVKVFLYGPKEQRQ